MTEFTVALTKRDLGYRHYEVRFPRKARTYNVVHNVVRNSWDVTIGRMRLSEFGPTYQELVGLCSDHFEMIEGANV